MARILSVLFLPLVLSSQQLLVTIQNPEPPQPTTSRIIGGYPANIEQYPYAVQILVGSGLQCGGSLLTRRHVLSAAHCFIDERGAAIGPRVFTVRAGTALLATGGTTSAISTIVVHERYNRFTFDNDVAVLVLATQLTLGPTIQVAAIPVQGHVVPYNSIVTTVGWGMTESGFVSRVLNQVQVFVVNQAVCAARYREIPNVLGQPSVVTTSMMCAGVLDVGGRDACQGDSGGPLIFNNVLVGVTSWGYSCAHPRYPGVNARVSNFTNWIDQTVRRHNAGGRLESVSWSVLVALAAYVILSDKY